MDTFGLNDHCIVPWQDGSMYAGRVQKILDPEREVVVQTTTTKARGGKAVHAEEATPLAAFRKSRHARAAAAAIEQSLATGRSWFYVHYSGWKPSHDEWIPEERMLPYTPRHIAEMKRVNSEIKERERAARQAREAAEKEQRQRRAKGPGGRRRAAAGADAGSAAPAASAASVQAAPAATARPLPKRTRQGTPAEDSLPLGAAPKRRRVGADDAQGPTIRIAVPLDLKRLLVRDWELVTHSRRIVQLPRPVSVVEILREFVAAHSDAVASGPNENLQQFADSIVNYFDYALGMMLLYRFERNQYYAERRPRAASFRASLVYGAEHLARLIVSMPAVLTQMAGMDDKTSDYVAQTVSALASFLTDNRARFFAGEKTYDSATRVYEAFAVPDMQGGDAGVADDEQVAAEPVVNGDAETAESV